MTENDRETLIDGARAVGVELDNAETDKLLRYTELVREWNQRINLVSRKDIGNLIPGHLVDSLAGLPLFRKLITSLPEPKAMDLGSGGGLPGIPLKICYPNIVLTFLESTKKKARFIELAVSELGLENSTVVDRHSTELEKAPAHRAKYDLVLARAVAELGDLIGLGFPFLKPGGRLMAYKAAKAEQEIAAAAAWLKRAGGAMEPGLEVSVGGKTRHIVVVRKAG